MNGPHVAPIGSAPDDSLPTPGPEARRPRVFLLIVVVAVALLVALLYWRAHARLNQVPLAAAPKPVTVITADATTYRGSRVYVGTTAAMNQANVGPQYVSAYVGTVLVRPGAVVKRGEVLATLDCRNASAGSREIAARARALEERRAAAQHESARVTEMKQGGFASDNEVEQLGARAAAEQAEVDSLKATLSSRALEVDDCILRAPFTGEVADRWADPGAYARPGTPVVTLIDRSTVRIVGEAPESDFTVVAPGTPVAIDIEASGAKLTARVSRRSPAADETTRTVHFEIDVPNPQLLLPANATARLTIDVGKKVAATRIALRAATVRGNNATMFVVNSDQGADRAQKLTLAVLGERGGDLFVDPQLPGGARVVLEGRALLDTGDLVRAVISDDKASAP